MLPSSVDAIDLLSVRLSAETRRSMNIHDVAEACARGDSSQVISAMIKGVTDEATSAETANASAGAEWKHSDIFGRSALHYAAMRGRPSVVRLLIAEGLDANEEDIHGAYPLHLAIQHNQCDAALCLAKHSRADLQTPKGENAIILLAKSKHHPREEALLRELLATKHDINHLDCRHCHALFYATERPALMRALIASGIDIHVTDCFNRSALFNGVYAISSECNRMLIAAGADVNARDDFDHTPLMLASCFGDVETVELLLRAGADVNAETFGAHWRLTPLTYAIRHGSYGIAKRLIGHGAKIDIQVDRDRDSSTSTSNASQPEVVWDSLTRQTDGSSLSRARHADAGAAGAADTTPAQSQSESDNDDAVEDDDDLAVAGGMPLTRDDADAHAHADAMDVDPEQEERKSCEEEEEAPFRNSTELGVVGSDSSSSSRILFDEMIETSRRQRIVSTNAYVSKSDLLAYAIATETGRKMDALLACAAIQELHVHTDILALIAHPLEW